MAGSTTEYIPHHLEHLRYSLSKGEFVAGDKAIVNFDLLNLDSLIMAGVLGLLFLVTFRLAARKVTTGVPGKFQAFVEIVVGIVDEQVRDVFHGDRRFVAVTLGRCALPPSPVESHTGTTRRPALS